MLLQGLHALFLGLQILVAWEFLIKGIELHPEVAQRLQLSNANRCIYPYLTVWNLVLHITYLVICAVEDVLIAFTNGHALVQLKKKLSKSRAFSFETLVFPGSLVVVSAFWSFTFVDPLYLFPGPIEDLIPHWINFLIHYGVGIFAVGELVLRREPWCPRHQLKRLQIGCNVFVFYFITICVHRYQSGAWIYPFIAHISWLQMIAIFAVFPSAAVLFYRLGHSVSILSHGNVIVRSKQA